MSRPNYLQETNKRIQAAPNGSVFVASDFADVAETKRISICLERLSSEKTISRVMRGVYYKPAFSTLLGETIAPSPDLVAHAIARNFGWTIVPCGDTALNLLGLSTQVPVVWSYVSDGAYKEYSYENTTIRFKRTTNKEISKLSPKTALVIQALKTLGKERIDDGMIEKIKSETTSAEREAMKKEAQYATAWIFEIIKSICR
ncbi:MAG: hypothetical protein IKP74_06655 [Clostridia bacterium]|nr:hypothetical protein [Clostridia bacterium]